MIEVPRKYHKSRPSAGRTMVGLMKELGTDIHHAYELLTQHLSKAAEDAVLKDWEKNVLLFSFSEQDKQILEHKKIHLISASLLSNLLCGVASQKLPTTASIGDAEKWFNNEEDSHGITHLLPSWVQTEVTNVLSGVLSKVSLEVLPYLFEVFETGQETPREIGASRVKKKHNGIYYTPTDVIEFIVESFVQKQLKEVKDLTWFDPAVGTGAFLIVVLNKGFSTCNNNHFDHFLANCLFGTDISPFALQSASYLIASNYLVKADENTTPRIIAKKIGKNLVLFDATKLINRKILKQVFEIRSEGFDCIISNPPYSKKRKEQFTIFNTDESQVDMLSDEIYTDFVRMLFDLTNPNGGGGMVVPLSLVCNSKAQFRSLRKYIQLQTGEVQFWNFDRTPDSLFGDDVKTRNTIVIFNSKDNHSTLNVNSTYLHRWNSRSRSHLFKSIPTAEISYRFDLANGIPKVGDEMGVSLLKPATESGQGVLSQVLAVNSNKPDLSIRTTAYNWIPVEIISNIPTHSIGRHFWSIQLTGITPEMIYSVLSSRLTYWLWRVWSDGFHVNNHFIGALPFGRQFFDMVDKGYLHKLGALLWANAQTERVVSRNAGVISYSYCPLKFDNIINDIDDLILTVHGISTDYTDYLKGHINSLIYAGRESELTISNKIKYLEVIQE